jgi:hypothetical protein
VTLPGISLALIINLVLFQLGWFVAVLLPTLYTLAYTLLFGWVHYRFVIKSKTVWLAIGVIAAIGIMIDSLLSGLGILPFELWLGIFCPPWLLLLWLMFATLVNHSLAWLASHLWLQPILGAIGGGGSYLAGAKLLGFSLSLAQSVSLVLLWACLLPLFFAINRRLVH